MYYLSEFRPRTKKKAPHSSHLNRRKSSSYLSKIGRKSLNAGLSPAPKPLNQLKDNPYSDEICLKKPKQVTMNPFNDKIAYDNEGIAFHGALSLDDH